MGDEPKKNDLGKNDDVRIALCLSGGGFRATFFHLGVIRFLRDNGFLSLVKDVFSVSGGSIIAGHLALRWSDYMNPYSDKGFHSASTELVRFGQADVRGRIIRRWLLFGWFLSPFARTRQLEQHLSRLYQDTELGRLPEDAPTVRFLCTSLTTGDCCYFSRQGYTILARDKIRGPFPATDLPLGRAVATSASFPPLFPALSLEANQVHASKGDMSYTDRLVDGGVFDNTGTWALARELADGQMQPVNFVIVSDASAAFDWHVEPSFKGIVKRNARATDILMERVARLERVKSIGQTPVCWLSLHDLVGGSKKDAPLPFQPQDPADQAMLRMVRTDLNTFRLEEIRTLAKHGYEVAWSFFNKLEPTAGVDQGKLWDPCPPGWPDYELIVEHRKFTHLAEPLRKVIKEAKELSRRAGMDEEESWYEAEEQRRALEVLRLTRRKLRHAASRGIGLWNHKDWTSYVLLLSGLLILAALGALVLNIVHCVHLVASLS